MTMDQPPAIVDYDSNDIMSVMQKLASITATTADARKILDTYKSREARETWMTIWGLEVVSRSLDLLKRDPNAKIPEEWLPLTLP